ncbi:MAG: transposase [Rhodobacteraceae bacterium]|nr:transposase [Paracoccaceae bacterium]
MAGFCCDCISSVLVDAHENTPRIQVLSVSDTGRRRRWTDEEKIRIVEESHCDGVTLAEVARRHEISRSMLYDWRYRHKFGMLGCAAHFMRLVPQEDGPSSEDLPPVITIDLGARCRVTIPADFDMEAAACLLNGLVVRP